MIEKMYVCDRCKSMAKEDMSVPLNMGWRRWLRLSVNDLYDIYLCEACADLFRKFIEASGADVEKQEKEKGV